MQRPNGSHHAEQVLAVLGDLSDRGSIANSWRRCLAHHKLDPERLEPPVVLSGAELRQARALAGRVLRAADPELDRLYALVASLGYVVLMADTQGAIVTRRATEADSASYRRWRLWTGALWDEAVEGTNGVGTCLAEQRTITVHRDQHFRTRHTSLTCTVSPVFDAVGRLAGALDISSFRPDPTGAVLPLAQAVTREAARRIEARSFHERHAASLIISLPEAAEGASVPLLALDEDRRVVGATRAARDALAIDEAAISAGIGVRDMAIDALGPGAMVDASRAVLAGALATMQGNVSAAAHALGISRATMHRKIKTFGLQVRRPR